VHARLEWEVEEERKSVPRAVRSAGQDAARCCIAETHENVEPLALKYLLPELTVVEFGEKWLSKRETNELDALSQGPSPLFWRQC
jgi:hypothetical protein